MTAARVGAADVAGLLLAAGADADAAGARSQTALMWAVAQRHPGVVEVLLDHGAAVDARSDVWTEVVKTTPEPWNPEYVTEVPQGGYTPLLFAARVGDLASARLLVEAGADVDDAPPYGTSATVVAAHSGHGDVAAYLLEQGADPNAAEAGYTALHAAILHQDAALVRALLDHGADPDAAVMTSTPVRRDAVDFYVHPSYVGATPFWLAARFGAPGIMHMLAERGANPAGRPPPDVLARLALGAGRAGAGARGRHHRPDGGGRPRRAQSRWWPSTGWAASPRARRSGARAASPTPSSARRWSSKRPGSP